MRWCCCCRRRSPTHDEISTRPAEVYRAEASKQTISTATDSVVEGIPEWYTCPLHRVYPVVFIDCVNVKMRDGQIANRLIYMAHSRRLPRRRRRPDAGLRRAERPTERGRRSLEAIRAPQTEPGLIQSLGGLMNPQVTAV
ncbi:transposase [Streptomyces erythrochromogenes]|uniref:transposase n=1 Tax=Streptomyces erythrochromogenes TaxID=285574 RepID=UPI0038183252